MPRKQKKYHFIYKTTCTITGRYYYGMHSTDNLADGYLGSGKRLWHSIRKHGKDNHIIEHLEFLSDRIELALRESELITEELLLDPMCMNLKVGGAGGNIGPNGEVLGGDKFKGALSYWDIPENRKRLNAKTTETLKRLWEDPNYRKARIETIVKTWTGRKHTEETKRKVGQANSLKQSGKSNSQFGTMWIHNTELKQNLKVKLEEASVYLESSWVKGRKMNF